MFRPVCLLPPKVANLPVEPLAGTISSVGPPRLTPFAPMTYQVLFCQCSHTLQARSCEYLHLGGTSCSGRCHPSFYGGHWKADRWLEAPKPSRRPRSSMIVFTGRCLPLLPYLLCCPGDVAEDRRARGRLCRLFHRWLMLSTPTAQPALLLSVCRRTASGTLSA